MNEEFVTGQPEQIDAAAIPEVEAPEPALSIADHRAQYDPKRDKSKDPVPEEPLAPLAANATEAEKAAHHSEQQRREKTGEFRPGKKRHRAASQQATAADAPRIQELTRRNKELQALIDAGKTASVAQAPVQATNGNAPAQRQPQQVIEPQRQPQAAAAPIARVSDPRDPEPKETDEKYTKSANGPLEYFQDWSRWNVRDEHRQLVAGQQRQRQEEQVNITFAQRAHVTAQRVPDFEHVVGALDAARVIPAGSAIDEFVLTDDNGPDVLYHLASNRQELDALLRLPVLRQIKHLSLLAQRYETAASPQTAAAGTTGSAPRSNVRHLVPRPPNPVRTEPQGATSGPPTDGSLSIAAHKKAFAPQRR